MKKKFTLLSLAALCFAFLWNGTVAFFTAEESTHNIITTGGVSIDIIERQLQPDGTQTAFPVEGVEGAMPGASVSKIVSIRNVGASPAWLRVRLVPDIRDASGEALPLTVGEAPVLAYDFAQDVWTEKDGWYYYAEPVPAGAETASLIDGVTLAPEMSNLYQGCTVRLTVSAQAVQSANNADSALSAQGWPVEVNE